MRDQRQALGRIIVVHPGHPAVGQTLPVVRRYRERGEQLWVIELPDRSRQYVPASWCTPLAVPSEDVAMADHPQTGNDSPQPPLFSLAGLRDLAALVRHLRERERAAGGEHNDGAAAEGPRDSSSTEPGAAIDQGEQGRERRAAEVVLLRAEGAKGAPGSTTIRIGWRSGAPSKLQTQRPGSGDHARTADAVVERLRTLAQQHPDDRVSELLNAEGLTTRMGFSWTPERVHRIRAYHGIPTACPVMPQNSHARGDGLISVRAAAERLGVTPE